jgi:predicted ABC-type ATPase
MAKPRIVILAGPNGAGKSTLAKYLVPDGADIREFVNADQIAAGLSAFAPESVSLEAGKVMLRRIDALLRMKSSFAFETTLASRSFSKLVVSAHAIGYEVELVYVSLPSYLVAHRRVASRVKDGGHGIPKDVITRRFFRSISNFFTLYQPIVNRWWMYDNTRLSTPVLVARGMPRHVEIFKEKQWENLNKLCLQKRPS